MNEMIFFKLCSLQNKKYRKWLDDFSSFQNKQNYISLFNQIKRQIFHFQHQVTRHILVPEKFFDRIRNEERCCHRFDAENHILVVSHPDRWWFQWHFCMGNELGVDSGGQPCGIHAWGVSLKAEQESGQYEQSWMSFLEGKVFLRLVAVLVVKRVMVKVWWGKSHKEGKNAAFVMRSFSFCEFV